MSQKPPIKLLGIPYDVNSSFIQGPALAPPRIRLMETDGSANIYAEGRTPVRKDIVYTDVGDMSLGKKASPIANQEIYDRVSKEIETGEKLLSLGGDHAISFPIIRAHLDRYPDLHILQFDAHSDLYDNFGDNPYSHASPFARLMETGKVQSLTQVGLRTLGPHQYEQAQRFTVNVVEMRNLTDDFIQELQGPLYISLDLDVLDPAFAPGISHYEPGGMQTRTLIDMIHKIKVPIIGADIVEYNPLRDHHNMTAMVAYKLMKELMVKMA